MKAELLSSEQIDSIHNASMRILEDTGVQVPHPDMLKRLADLGASVDMKQQRVHIPEKLVARSVDLAGKQFAIYGRDTGKKAVFGQGCRNYNSIAGESSWLDEIGGERRFASLDDVALAARFADALDNINIVGAMSDPHELPVEYRCVSVFAAQMRNTTKPVTFWFHDRTSAEYVVEMMIALRGSEEKAEKYPLCYPFFEPISPLRFPFNGIDLLYETARLNLPVPIGPMAQMGVSAPMSIAGTMAQENAEILAGLCITQAIKPGMPVCYGGICHAFDMRTTQMIFCGPEQAMFGVGMTQMGKHYGLPVYINVGLTDAKRPDAQAGLEIAATLSLGSAAGADIFGHMGICGVDQASSLDMLTLQNEVIGYTESLMREVDVSTEKLGLDTLNEVGPGGMLLDSEHTLNNYRQELWQPALLDRDYYQAWKDKGCVSMEDRCVEEKRRILESHQVEPLPEDIEKAVSEIVKSAKKNLSVT